MYYGTNFPEFVSSGSASLTRPEASASRLLQVCVLSQRDTMRRGREQVMETVKKREREDRDRDRETERRASEGKSETGPCT